MPVVDAHGGAKAAMPWRARSGDILKNLEVEAF